MKICTLSIFVSVYQATSIQDECEQVCVNCGSCSEPLNSYNQCRMCSEREQIYGTPLQVRGMWVDML